MPDFERYTCVECGDDFTAHPSGNAADRELCSPTCETDRL